MIWRLVETSSIISVKVCDGVANPLKSAALLCERIVHGESDATTLITDADLNFSLLIRRQSFFLVCVAGAMSCVLPQSASGFSFIFTSGTNPNVVAHPAGYAAGVSGVLNVSIGIDPTTSRNGIFNANDLVVSVENVIRTWNALVPTTGNLLGPSPGMAFSQFDFESVLLHEVGHSIGLDHNNLGFQPGAVTGPNTNFGIAAPGNDGVFTFNSGPDGIIGSRDDIRGDDVNLNYFRTSGNASELNNPFTIADIVDSTTYSRDLDDLPPGDSFASVSGRANAVNFPSVAPNTEAVLNQGTFNGEVQRTLGHDDVAGRLFAQSGLDRIAGTADDYTLNLTFAGLTDDADIVIDFDSNVAFAVSTSGGQAIGSNAIAITNNRIAFSESADFFFNQVSNAVAVPEPGSMLACGLILSFGVGRRRRADRPVVAADAV